MGDTAKDGWEQQAYGPTGLQVLDSRVAANHSGGWQRAEKASSITMQQW